MGIPPEVSAERKEKLKKFVATGMNQEKAMICAGYSVDYARGRAYRSKSLKDIVARAKTGYQREFINTATVTNFSGADAAKRLIEIAKDGKDFDSVAAIKAINMIMFAPSRESVSHINLSGIFIVPERGDQQNWKDQAISVESDQKQENV